jgi:CBS domain containing-hemolysin-like protein/mannitol/fructose-specific phosphotransferase system IIA component (Ntr-type)
MIFFLVAVLIGINATFVLLEFGLMRSRPARLEMLARKGNARAIAVQEVLARLDEHLAAMQVCIALDSLALGAVGEPAVAAWLFRHFAGLLAWFPAGSVRVVSFAISVVTLAFLQMIMGELVPRAVALRYAETIALNGARPLKALALSLRWPIRLTTTCSRAILRLFGVRPGAEAEHSVSVEEMRVLLGETQDKGAMPLERLILLENVFDFASAKAAEAMRPREKIAYLSLAKSWAENMAVVRAKRFTRYPLCEKDDLDTAIGYVHLKDLILREDAGEPALKHMRRDLFEISDAEPLEKLIKSMPDKGIHMALVRDGLNRVAGLLTLEDIVEELIGEVRDEFGRPRGWADGDLFARAVTEANLPPGDRREAISYLIARLKTARPDLDSKTAFEAVIERESKFASAVGRGVIVPHARLPGLPEPIIAVGRYAKPASFPTPDNVPVRLVFLILTPVETPVIQLKILQRIASLVTNENLRRKLWRAKTDEALLEILRTADTLLAS